MNLSVMGFGGFLLRRWESRGGGVRSRVKVWVE
jgi:hypothetical protein